MRTLCLAAAATLTLLGPSGAAAEAVGSVYTRHTYETCPVVKEHEAGRAFRCAGHRGIPVTYDADEHNVLVGIGSGGEAASTDWLTRHNAEAGPTIEWRGIRRGHDIDPFAAILRFRVTASPAIGAPRRDVLVVYRVDRVRSCIVAVLDGRRADANTEARRVADASARTFRCGRDRPSSTAE